MCRDYTHLAVALCRCMNIPARYCTGYLGDIGVPPRPMIQWTSQPGLKPISMASGMSLIHPTIRQGLGRVLMARGRDAVDVPISNTFGLNTLKGFKVWAEEPTRIRSDRSWPSPLSRGILVAHAGNLTLGRGLAGLQPLGSGFLGFLGLTVRSFLPFSHNLSNHTNDSRKSSTDLGYMADNFVVERVIPSAARQSCAVQRIDSPVCAIVMAEPCLPSLSCRWQQGRCGWPAQDQP